MSPPFSRKYLATLLFALACVLALAGAGWHSIVRLRDDVALTQHTREVQNQIDLVHITLLNLEESHQAFLLTQDAADFEPYLLALRRLKTEMEALAALTAQHAEQGPDLARLQTLVQRQRDALTRAIEDRRSSHGPAVVAGLHNGAAKELMVQIRDVLARMDHEESRALAAHQAAADRQLRLNMLLGAAVIVVTTLMLAAIYFLMRRELAARDRAERAEAEHRSVLEHDIELRSRELAQATDALVLSEARLRGIFDSATDAILTVDQTQTIVLANPAAARMLRCPQPQLLGAALGRFVPPAVGALSLQREVSGHRADGEQFPIEAAISHLQVGGQELYTVILRDVTERKRAEAELRDSEARFRQVLTMLPEPVVIESGDRITFANEATQRLMGLGEDELIGRSPLSFCHPDSVETVKQRLACLMAGQAVAPAIEIKALGADGRVRVVESTAARIDFRGDVSVIAMMRDVTDLRRVQRELSRSHTDLQRLVAAQGRVQEEERKRIARELHDELQQKLAAILMNLSAAKNQLQGDPGNATAALTAAHELAVAVIESTRRIVNDLRPQVLDDLGLVAALQVLASNVSRASGMACHVNAEPAAARRAALSADVQTCLYRVAQESLNNVVKHAQASEVHIELARAESAGIVLRVRDNGNGMSPDWRGKPDSFGVLGMQERLRLVGGSLTLHSHDGGGTVVQALLRPKPKHKPGQATT
jgi:PAS domain S-box-containing protein